jgi:hypothetical protein
MYFGLFWYFFLYFLQGFVPIYYWGANGKPEDLKRPEDPD